MPTTVRRNRRQRAGSRRVLGRYRLIEELALGGTARIMRARDEQLERDVAVKLLHPHLLPDESSRRRLAAEARSAAALSHPGIVTVYDFDTDPDSPALIMELVDGESLAGRLSRSGPLPPYAVAQIGAEVADALFLAHRRGIVHRDVKPGNILLEHASGRAKLVDFGIAHSLAVSSEALTQTGTTPGTLRYMSPEQLAGDEVGPRTDLWSLGAVLFEALTGRPPFEARSPLAMARQQQAGPPQMGDVDPTLAALIRDCLAYEVERRPVHAGAVADLLRGWLSGGEAITTEQAVVPVAAAEPLPSAPPSPARRLRRVPAWAVAATAAGVLGFAILIAMVAPNLRPAVADLGASPGEATPSPTVDLLGPLLASYEDVCGATPPPDELAERDVVESEEWLEEAIGDCRKEAEDAEDKKDNEDGDEGRGNGRGKDEKNEGGNGNGGN